MHLLIVGVYKITLILNYCSTVIQIRVTIQNLSAVSAWSTDSLLKLNLKSAFVKNKGRCSGRLILLKKSHREITRRQIMANGNEEVTAITMACSGLQRHHGLKQYQTFLWAACSHWVYILNRFLPWHLCAWYVTCIDFCFNQHPLGKQAFPRILIPKQCEDEEQRETAMTIPGESSIYPWWSYQPSEITPPAQELQRVWYHGGNLGISGENQWFEGYSLSVITHLVWISDIYSSWQAKHLSLEIIMSLSFTGQFFWAISIPEGTHHQLVMKKALNARMTYCISCGHLFKGQKDQTTADTWQSLQLGQRHFSAFCFVPNSCILEMRSLCQQRVRNLEPLLLQMIPVCHLGPEYVCLNSIIHKWFLLSLLNYMFSSY